MDRCIVCQELEALPVHGLSCGFIDEFGVIILKGSGQGSWACPSGTWESVFNSPWMKLTQYISFTYCKRNVISYLLDSCENFLPETRVLNCTVVFTLPSRTDENRATRLQRRREKCAVNVWNGDASSVLLPLKHFPLACLFGRQRGRSSLHFCSM